LSHLQETRIVGNEELTRASNKSASKLPIFVLDKVSAAHLMFVVILQCSLCS
jgi:hypothetical protein